MDRHIGKYLLTMFLIVAGSISSWAQKELSVDDKNVDNKNLIYDGIDVSSYQQDIDWSATAQDKNIKFVYVKATEGSSYRSRHYEANIENARKEGIRVGSYHYLTTHTSMQRQFENFISIVKKEDQDLVPLIDIEEKKMWTPQEMCDSLIKFANLLEDYYGCRPMIYTGSAFYNSYLAGRIKGYPLFIARYSKYQPRLHGGAKWVLWQFSERGRISGIDHYVDLCRFNTGCGLKDILMKKHGGSKSHKEATPPARKTAKAEEKAAPAKKEPELTDKEKEKQAKEHEKQLKEQQKAKEKAEKEAKKKAEQKARQDAEAARQLKEKQEKEAKERQKAKEKAEKEKAKQLKAQQEKAAKEAKLRQEQAAKAAKEKQAQAEKAAKEKAAKEAQAAKEAEKTGKKASAPADVFKGKQKATTTPTNTSKTKAKTSTATTKAKADSATKKQQTTSKTTQSANQKAKAAGKRVNGSSADND